MQIQKKCFVSEEQGRTMDFAFHLKYSFRSLEWNQEHCRGEGACGEGRGQCVSEEQCRADQVVVGWGGGLELIHPCYTLLHSAKYSPTGSQCHKSHFYTQIFYSLFRLSIFKSY